MSSMAFLPILLMVIILLFGYQMMNHKKGAIMIGRNIHFKIVVIFIAILIVTTVIAEAYHSKIDSAITPKVVENHYEAYYQIEDEIINHGSVDPDLLLEKRTHAAGKTLTIQWEDDSYENYHQSIYIERKAPGDQTIEEFIYKPILIANEFDFSQMVNTPKPIWSENKMFIPKKPVNNTITFTTYHDAALLQQLTKTQQLQSNDYGFSSEYRHLIIHLKIPADLEVVASDEGSLYFIDE